MAYRNHSEMHRYAGKSIIEKLWDELDLNFKSAMREEINGLTEQTRLFGICRGLAIAIFVMSKPQFNTIDDVAREAQRRYEMSN